MDAGLVIVGQGDRGRECSVIIEGEVQIESDDEVADRELDIIARLGVGQSSEGSRWCQINFVTPRSSPRHAAWCYRCRVTHLMRNWRRARSHSDGRSRFLNRGDDTMSRGTV